MLKRFILFFLIIFPGALTAQDSPTVSEQLGFDPDAKLLILHADDLGVTHSVNKASFEALANGDISSASIMVPCPWLLEVAEEAKKHPEYDLGLHLTLTAEWEQFKWDGVTTTPASSLVNDYGYLYDNVQAVIQHADPEDVRREIQGQIDMARKVGISPTHLDSHMGTLFASPQLFRIYVETGQKNRLPVFVPKAATALFTEDFPITDDIIPITYLGSMNPGIEHDGWESHYTDLLKAAQPGLNEIIIHLGFDDEEMQAVMINHPDFGAKWRELDLATVQSPAFKQALKENNIHLVTYRQIQELLYGADE